MATSRETGFTLMEVLLALGLFTIVMGSLPAVLISNTRANAFARRLTTAAGMAQDKIEVIRNMRYIDVVDGSDTPTDPTDVMSYTRTWTVTAGPTDATKKVAVVVSWADQSARQVEIDAIIGS
jgi:Tfp pilus assembly protein PilV